MKNVILLYADDFLHLFFYINNSLNVNVVEPVKRDTYFNDRLINSCTCLNQSVLKSLHKKAYICVCIK